MKSKNLKSKTEENSERGAALILSIFGILLVTVIAFALVSTALISQDISRNAREQTETYYISEAGLTHATELVTTAGQAQFNNILQAGDGVANTGDELSGYGIPLMGVGFGRGTYLVYISDDAADGDGNPNADSNGRIVIRSVGNGQNGASVTTEAIVAVSGSPAILVNGNLKFTGNSWVQGVGGSVHANGVLDLSGIPCANLYFSASSNIINTTNSRTGVGCASVGVTRANQPVIPVPTWNIPSLKTSSDYVLALDGRVYNGAGTLIHDATSTGNKWTVGSSEWSWDSGSQRWVHGGNVIQNGTYYSEGNMEISGNFGTSGSPATVTLLAEGYLNVSGNPFMRPDYQSFSLMAGTDLRISGNPGAGEINFSGIHYAGHQLGFSGNPTINGVVIAANIADTNSSGCGCNFIPLSSGYMEISGNPVITYDGGLLNSGVNIISWREVRY
jgi:hypothetical protein